MISVGGNDGRVWLSLLMDPKKSFEDVAEKMIKTGRIKENLVEIVENFKKSLIKLYS